MERVRLRDVLRLLPIGALAALTAVVVVERLRTPAPLPRAAITSATVAVSSSGSAPGLAGPSPPPPASVASGAARMLHGDRRHTHRAAAAGPRAARVAWRTEVGGPVASQVVASPDERTLYVATLAGDLVALDAGGQRAWSVALGERVYSTPFVDDSGTILVGTDAKTIVAVSPKGKIEWKLEVDGEVDSGVTRGPDGLFVAAAGSTVVAVRPGGDVAWRFKARGKVFSQPAVTPDGLLVFGSQDDAIYAVDRAGKERFRVALGADVDASPCVADDGSIYVGTDAGEIVKLDPGGRVAWRTAVGGFVRGALAVARNGDVLAGTYGPAPRVVRVRPDGTLAGAHAIQGTGAKEFGIHGAPLEDATGALFFGAQDDRVYAIDASGALLFVHETKGDVDGPLTLLSDGTLLVPSEDGSVTALR